MRVGYLGFVLLVLTAFRPTAPRASELKCITAWFFGANQAFEDAVVRQLSTEPSNPVFLREGSKSCGLLNITLRNRAARVSLEYRRLYHTQIDLAKVAPELWPRAVALAVNGLLVLAQSPGEHASAPTETGDGMTDRAQDAANPKRPKTDDSPSGRAASPKTDAEGSLSKVRANGSRGVEFALTLGMRLILQLRVGVFDLALGIAKDIAAVRLELSLLGLWGRKSLDEGYIITTGGGIRASVFWLPLNRPSVSLGIGPSIEVLGVLGYGRADEGVEPHREFAPVVNLLLFASGRFEITPSVRVVTAVGGGAAALYFKMRADKKTVSGISGGCLSFTLGFVFGRSGATTADTPQSPRTRRPP